MELKPTQYTPRLTSGEGLIERTGRVRRQIIEHDPDAVRFGKVKVGKLGLPPRGNPRSSSRSAWLSSTR